jgi:PAS domain S-box-containing protein
LCAVVAYLFKETLRLQSAEAKCQAKCGQMQAEIWALNTRTEQLSWVGDADPIAVIVADANTGLITEWSPGATMLLHYPARTMLGKPLTKLMPQRLVNQHTAAMDKLKSLGGIPRRGPFGFFAITQEGTEIPVEVTLSGWSKDAARFVGARIRPRIVEYDGAAKNESPVN